MATVYTFTSVPSVKLMFEIKGYIESALPIGDRGFHTMSSVESLLVLASVAAAPKFERRVKREKVLTKEPRFKKRPPLLLCA
jgi:hypothetical protein